MFLTLAVVLRLYYEGVCCKKADVVRATFVLRRGTAVAPTYDTYVYVYTLPLHSGCIARTWGWTGNVRPPSVGYCSRLGPGHVQPRAVE